METPMALEVNKNDNSQTEQQFINFLNENRVKSGKFTHTGVGKNTGKFLIEGPQLKTFFNYMGKLLQENVPTHIIEHHADIGPFIIDIDLRLKLDNKKRSFGYSFVKKICQAYIDQINLYFDFSSEQQRNELLRAFVFERPEPVVSKTQMKDGLHIMFPFIVSEPAVQNVVRDNVIKELEEYFKTMPFENNISSAVDKLVIDQVGWYMYGSTKPGIPRYDLKYIFDCNLTPIELKLYKDTQLPSLLSIRNKTETTPIKSSKLEEVNNYKVKVSDRKKKRKKESTNLTEDDLAEIFDLVNILSPKRADDYNSWIDLGFALHAIEPHNDDLLGIWDDFSRQSAKYDPTACEKYWENMKEVQDGLNLGSIHYWARLDDPEKYAEFRNGQTRSFIEQSMTGTNVDIAKVLYRLYKYQYVCASIKNQKWYTFQKHHWIEDETGISLRNKICNELVEEYCKLISYYNEKIDLLEDQLEEETDKKKKYDLESKKKQNVSQIEKLTTIIKNLKTTSFIENVMKECRGLFYDKDFLNKLDEDHYKFSFKNGVLDLKTGQFRDGKPDDFISLSCGVNYIPYRDDLPYLEDLNDFLYKVQTDQDDRNYMITLMSSFLEGHNADESFHFWTGSGGNGKSKINQLLVEAMGAYSCKFPITLFTAKRGASNSVSPEVIESKGKRYAYCEEPDEGERINVGLMKEYTGGDKIKGRGLWSNFQEIKPQFKMILFCNDMPKLPPDDNGTWRRVKALEFKSSFVNNPKNENEFRIDKYLGNKLPLWSETFMALLVHTYFNVYKKTEGGLIIPPSVLKFTSEYQKDMDINVDFITSKLIKTDKKTDKISLQSLHDEFRAWFTSTYNCSKYPLKSQLKKYLEKKFGKKCCTTTHLIGFVMNSANLDDDEDND